MNIFEHASRRSLRFATPVGTISTEDLWGLPLQARNAVNLDMLAVGLDQELKLAPPKSFVNPEATSGATVELQLKFDIVQHVITTRLAEAAVAEASAATRERKQKLLSIIADKQDEELTSKSVEELQALVEAM